MRTNYPAALALVLLLFLRPVFASAEVRFDVFVGLDGYVPTHGWFPVTCEVQNDGPTFTGVFEVTSDDFAGGEVRRMRVELPTGTLKRFSVPFHTSSTYAWRFSARLLDERGKVQAEAANLNTRKQIPRDVPLSASVGVWIPALPESRINRNRQEYQPVVARLLPPLLPDNPITLETLQSVYLGSDKALELDEPQIEALLTWLAAGGHLIVGVKQPGHLSGAAWLERLLPAQITGMELATNHLGLQRWLTSDEGVDGREPRDRFWDRNRGTRGTSNRGSGLANLFREREADAAFEEAAMEVATGTVRDGRIVAGPENKPLVVSAKRGRGRLTTLLFNPELKPFADWQHSPYFWVKLLEIPPSLFVDENINLNRYQSVDGVYASTVDSHQVRKLPVGWLLLLLVGYLVVIGPLDRYWLKKINRQMLTWLTFPAYVAFFSLLIYFIGYKLRAGETEWNELHIVDILPKGRQADWHGWTYGSIYSPANARYEFQGSERFSAFRSEFGGGSGRHGIESRGNNFLASVSVPVWTSQLFVSDWWNSGLPPLTATVQSTNGGYALQLENVTDHRFQTVFIVVGERIHTLDGFDPNTSDSFFLPHEGGTALNTFVNQQTQPFQSAINRRRNPLSGNAWEVIKDIPRATVAAAFLERSEHQPMLAPFGQDLTEYVEEDHLVVLAWMADEGPLSKPMHQFRPRRYHQDTLWRLVVPLEGSKL